MQIPIIVINWNGYQDTIECMESVLALDYPDFMIYLVDNGSNGDEGRRLEELFASDKRVTTVILPDNLGFGKANNEILANLSKDRFQYVALLNNDTTVAANWLSALTDCAKHLNADLVSSKMLNYFNRDVVDNLGHQMLNTGEILPIAHGKPDMYNRSFDNLGCCAGAALYSLDMLNEIGFFDDFFNTGYEDAELGLRAFVAGFHPVFCPSALVYHKGGKSIEKIFDHNYVMRIQTGIWYTYFKLMPAGVILLSLPFIIIKFIILTLINLIFFRFDYLKIQWKSIFRIFSKHRKEMFRSRREFYERCNTISTSKILRAQKFFFLYDLRRFFRIYIRGEKSAMDEYRSEAGGS